MEKLITGYFTSVAITSIHWITELTPILEFASIVVGFLGILGTTILVWKKVLITKE
ncbi:MAG TPA: hypothetical protein VMV77_04800 [Bacteroidales bacterium]|nr:hypothetical protein [Bacteroidales bacterium]